MGGGSTIWRGTAFNCAGNEIVLRHSRFSESNGVSGECNSGTIVGQSIRVNDNCYTSQLEVNVTAELHNTTVICLVNSNTTIIPIDEVSVISVATGNSNYNVRVLYLIVIIHVYHM